MRHAKEDSLEMYHCDIFPVILQYNQNGIVSEAGIQQSACQTEKIQLYKKSEESDIIQACKQLIKESGDVKDNILKILVTECRRQLRLYTTQVQLLHEVVHDHKNKHGYFPDLKIEFRLNLEMENVQVSSQISIDLFSSTPSVDQLAEYLCLDNNLSLKLKAAASWQMRKQLFQNIGELVQRVKQGPASPSCTVKQIGSPVSPTDPAVALESCLGSDDGTIYHNRFLRSPQNVAAQKDVVRFSSPTTVRKAVVAKTDQATKHAHAIQSVVSQVPQQILQQTQESSQNASTGQRQRHTPSAAAVQPPYTEPISQQLKADMPIQAPTRPPDQQKTGDLGDRLSLQEQATASPASNLLASFENVSEVIKETKANTYLHDVNYPQNAYDGMVRDHASLPSRDEASLTDQPSSTHQTLESTSAQNIQSNQAQGGYVDSSVPMPRSSTPQVADLNQHPYRPLQPSERPADQSMDVQLAYDGYQQTKNIGQELSPASLLTKMTKETKNNNMVQQVAKQPASQNTIDAQHSNALQSQNAHQLFQNSMSAHQQRQSMQSQPGLQQQPGALVGNPAGHAMNGAGIDEGQTKNAMQAAQQQNSNQVKGLGISQAALNDQLKQLGGKTEMINAITQLLNQQQQDKAAPALYPNTQQTQVLQVLQGSSSQGLAQSRGLQALGLGSQEFCNQGGMLSTKQSYGAMSQGAVFSTGAQGLQQQGLQQQGHQQQGLQQQGLQQQGLQQQGLQQQGTQQQGGQGNYFVASQSGQAQHGVTHQGQVNVAQQVPMRDGQSSIQPGINQPQANIGNDSSGGFHSHQHLAQQLQGGGQVPPYLMQQQSAEFQIQQILNPGNAGSAPNQIFNANQAISNGQAQFNTPVQNMSAIQNTQQQALQQHLQNSSHPHLQQMQPIPSSQMSATLAQPHPNLSATQRPQPEVPLFSDQVQDARAGVAKPLDPFAQATQDPLAQQRNPVAQQANIDTNMDSVNDTGGFLAMLESDDIFGAQQNAAGGGYAGGTGGAMMHQNASGSGLLGLLQHPQQQAQPNIKPPQPNVNQYPAFVQQHDASIGTPAIVQSAAWDNASQQYGMRSVISQQQQHPHIQQQQQQQPQQHRQQQFQMQQHQQLSAVPGATRQLPPVSTTWVPQRMAGAPQTVQVPHMQHQQQMHHVVGSGSMLNYSAPSTAHAQRPPPVQQPPRLANPAPAQLPGANQQAVNVAQRPGQAKKKSRGRPKRAQDNIVHAGVPVNTVPYAKGLNKQHIKRRLVLPDGRIQVRRYNLNQAKVETIVYNNEQAEKADIDWFVEV